MTKFEKEIRELSPKEIVRMWVDIPSVMCDDYYELSKRKQQEADIIETVYREIQDTVADSKIIHKWINEVHEEKRIEAVKKHDKETTWIPLGCVYDLREDYRKCYHLAHLYVSADGEEIKAQLQSNWNSSYDAVEIKTVISLGGSVMSAIDYYKHH